MAELCASSLRPGVWFSDFGRVSGGFGRLTSRNTDCTLALSVEVAERLLSDGRDLRLTPTQQEHISGGLRRDSASVNWSMILEHRMSTSNNRDR